MKKTKQPGDNISLKTKKTEDPAVMKWINEQSNLMDSLRYLIENEIVQNGVRNLQMFIPVERNLLHAGQPQQQQAAIIAPALGAAREVSTAAEERGELQSDRSEPPVEDEIDDDDIESWI
ncbi:hypothetical protein [Paenibacillus abyssi]|uniref:Uncharacterized protein n=1 Tax=Paenibacillus abyssi TaxID=1340531 RepID=A0A917CNV5_9BACL|nr:hypothetical protein [Paenibacillus abyssi]GGF93513.1 hypothetical protein GCM10010916_08590 [Paenibacillus abyssi]